MNNSLAYSFFFDGSPFSGETLPDKLKPYLTDDKGRNFDVVGFIGFSDSSEKFLCVILPKNYPPPSDNEKEKTARLLLKTLLDFRRRHFSIWEKNVVCGEFDGGSFFAEMEFIICAWKMYGCLRRRHRRYKQKGVGHIDWQRTFHRVQPIFSYGSPMYYPPILAIRDATQDEMIQRIHAYVVWSILQKWGGLFDASWEGDEPARPASNAEMCRVLRQELSSCFVERESELLWAVLHYLEAQDGFGKKHTPQTFLVKFELIWEDICGKILENQYDSLKKYIPHAVYTSNIGVPTDKVNVKPPIPDILCQSEDGNKIYIFDAKYYKEAPPFFCAPCMKQFMYAYLIEAMLVRERTEPIDGNEKIPTAVAANVFLLPKDGDDGNSASVNCAGNISLEGNGGRKGPNINTIVVLHVPIKTMMEEYVMNAKDGRSMKSAIYEALQLKKKAS